MFNREYRAVRDRLSIYLGENVRARLAKSALVGQLLREEGE